MRGPYPARQSLRVGDAERSRRRRRVAANNAPICAPEARATASNTTAEDKRSRAARGAALLPRFFADEDAEVHTASSRHLVVLPFGSVTPSREAVGQSSDAPRKAEPLHDLSAPARADPAAPGRGKCGTTPPQGRWRRLTGGLNDKK